MSAEQETLMSYPVWDRSIRWFHWINVLALIAIGLVILNSKLLGIADDGKVLLKTWHGVWFGALSAIAIVAGGVITELRERNGLVSAMFTGRKVFRDKPLDLDD